MKIVKSIIIVFILFSLVGCLKTKEGSFPFKPDTIIDPLTGDTIEVDDE